MLKTNTILKILANLYFSNPVSDLDRHDLPLSFLERSARIGNGGGLGNPPQSSPHTRSPGAAQAAVLTCGVEGCGAITGNSFRSG